MSKEQIKSARNIEQHGEELSLADESVLYTELEFLLRQFAQGGRVRLSSPRGYGKTTP